MGLFGNSRNCCKNPNNFWKFEKIISYCGFKIYIPIVIKFKSRTFLTIGYLTSGNNLQSDSIYGKTKYRILKNAEFFVDDSSYT